MIVLDTNVLSELMVPPERSDRAVDTWFEGVDFSDLFTTAVCTAEILSGLAMMPTGRRLVEKASAAHRILDLFRGRVLPFDEHAAEEYGPIAARGRSRLPINALDFQVAAIARANGMAVATRNVSDFADCGVEVIDPWTAA